jgi:PAS domain S-box-containing protein
MTGLIAPFRRLVEDMPLTTAIAVVLAFGLVLPFSLSMLRQGEVRREALLGLLADDHSRILETLAIGMAMPIWEVRPDVGRPLIDAVMRDDRVTAVVVSAPLLPEFLVAAAPERRQGEPIAGEAQVVYRGAPIGTVRVEMTAGPVEAELAELRNQMLLTGFVQLAMGLVLIYAVLRLKVLAPIRRLLQQSRALANGQLAASAAWTRGDEIGVLGRGFEEARRSLQRLVHDLEERNKTLAAREADLRRQTRILRATLENMSDGITLVDGDLRLQAWNDRFLALFQLPEGLARTGVPLAEIHDVSARQLPFPDPAKFKARLEASLQAGQAATVQLETVDGKVILCRRRPLAEGGFVTTYADISEQVRAQRQAEESLHLLEAVMNGVPAMLHVKDSDLRYRMVNRSFLEAFGIERKEVIGRRIEEVFPDPECHAGPQQADQEVLRSGRPSPFSESQFRLPTGEVRDCLTTRMPLRDGYGHITHIVTVMVDISERTRAERALRESEERHRLLVDLSPYGIMLHDNDGITLLNPAGCRILHLLSADAARGHHYLDFVAPEEKAEARERMRRMFEGGELLPPIERRMRTAGGLAIDVSVVAVPFRQGGRLMALVIFNDITEAKRLERERQRWLQLFNDAVESMPSGFAVYDSGNRLVACNSAFADLYETTPTALQGSPLAEMLPQFVAKMELIDGRPAAEVGARLTSMLEGHQLAEIGPLQVTRKDGRSAMINYYPSAEGGFVVIRTDVTHLVRMQEALRESEELYRLLTDVSPFGILLLDENGVVFVNAAGSRVLGAERPEQVIGHSWIEFVAPEERELAMARIRAVLEANEEIVQTERRLVTLDRREITVITSARPLQRGNRHLGLVMFSDISELKRAEAEIARQREALHQAEKMSAFGSLLAGVAHELNNPLSVVVGRAVMLQEATDDPRVVAGIRKIRDAAERCARIVKMFLAMARRQESMRTAVRIPLLIEGSLDLLAYGLTSAGIRVVREFEPDVPETLADADQLTQVFHNLIVNSKQAMLGNDDERILKISVGRNATAGQIVITVADSGPGIPPEIRPRIFDPYFTTKPAGVGTGVGLAVCRGLVEAHGGHISAEAPSSGRGAVFRVVLPIVAPGPEAGAETERHPLAAGSARILVADDEAEIGAMLKDLLAGFGHRVDVVRDGRAALERLERDRYDVVISDLVMPNLDGPALYRRIKRRRPDLVGRLIFVTGDTLSPTVKRFLSRVHRPVIEKPFTPDDVRRAVEQTLAAA